MVLTTIGLVIVVIGLSIRMIRLERRIDKYLNKEMKE